MGTTETPDTLTSSYDFAGADTSSDTLEKKIPFLSKIGFTSIALCLGLMFAGFVVFLEVMFPWTSSDERPVAFSLQPSTNNPFTTPAGWPPGLAGACIGFLQIPGVLLLNKAIGSSSAYVTAVAQCFPDGTCEKGRLDLIKSKRAGYWQLAYIIGAVLGGYLGALPVEQTTLGSSVVVNILGGMLVLFGSRLGQGCTSGHGISGFSLLGTHSIVATCTMFGGGKKAFWCFFSLSIMLHLTVIIVCCVLKELLLDIFLTLPGSSLRTRFDCDFGGCSALD